MEGSDEPKPEIPSFYARDDPIELGAVAPEPDSPGCAPTLGAFAVGSLFLLAAAGISSVLLLRQSTVLLLAQLALVMGVAGFLFIAGYPLEKAFRFRKVDSSVYTLAVLLGIALLLANFAATLLVGPSPRDIELVHPGLAFGERILLVITVAAIAPLVEESLFRGLLQGAFETRAPYWVAISLAAIPFAVLHGWPAGSFFFFWSLPIGWITWRTASIRPGLVVHVVNNIVGIVGLFAVSPASTESFERTPASIIFALLLLVPAGAWVIHLCRRIGGIDAADAETAPSTIP